MSKSAATSFHAALFKLENEAKERAPRQAINLTLKEIKTAPIVFQPRDIDHAFLDSEQHIKALSEAIVEAPGHVPEQLTVWWRGQRWYIIDGHHRLDAYKRSSCRR